MSLKNLKKQRHEPLKAKPGVLRKKKGNIDVGNSIHKEISSSDGWDLESGSRSVLTDKPIGTKVPMTTKADAAVASAKPNVKGKRKGVLTKRERRQLKLKSKKHSEVVIKILPLWELLRRDDTPKEKRFEIVTEILSHAKGKVADLCFAHDTARIIEGAIQHGTELHRWDIFSEIAHNLRLMAKSLYSKFVLIKLVKYGAKEHRLEIFKRFRGHVARLVCHRIAAEVVDLLYNDYANATQRGELMQELYGNVNALRLAENRVHTLRGALSINDDKRQTILSNVNELLVNLASKGLTKFSIVQHLLLEYLQVVCGFDGTTAAPKEPHVIAKPTMETDDLLDEATANLTEDNFLSLLEVLVKGQIVPMLHTREGVRAALYVLWAASPKLRKALVRSLKTCISSIARNEHGHLFIIGLLDWVDDIALLAKSVIKEILEDLKLFCTHPECRKVLLYALSPRDQRHFSPQLQQGLFHTGDSNPYTKTPLGVRALELRTSSLQLLPSLLRMVSDHLLDVFVGGSSTEGLLALEDRGRLILLAEILIRSAPYHLDADRVFGAYSRTNPHVLSTPDSVSPIIGSDELKHLQQLRQNALFQIVKQLLVPDFLPIGPFLCDTSTFTHKRRDEERIKRHKRAVTLVEQAIHRSTKPPFSSFETSKDTSDNFMDVDQSSASANLRVPFLERPEGQLFLRRLLQDGKLTKDFTLGRLIMEHVPPSNLCAWTRCNRSCFVLVNLFELGDPAICKLLISALTPCLTELSVSPLAGSKILCKHLDVC